MKIIPDDLNKKQLVLLVVILIGLVVSIYLIQKETFFNPKAAGVDVVTGAIELKQQDDGEVKCQDRHCETKSLDIKVRFDPKKMNVIDK